MSTESNQTEDAPSGFADLGLDDRVLEALAAVGYEVPSAIQARTIPTLMSGKDLLGQAQTGTGKTAAFATPILSRIELKRRVPQAMVLVPTRELAIQVSEAFQRYASGLKGFHVLPVYGGQPYERQLRPLKRGVHVVVGTPGRVMDHMRKGTLKLDGLTTLVLDEADEMLRMGFIEDVMWILEQTPDTMQIALFSATLPDAVRRIAQKHLKNPVEVMIKTRARSADSIRQRYCIVGQRHKLDALTRVLEAETTDGALVFVRTKTATVELAEKLEARGYNCSPLNGDIPQHARERTVDRFKSGKLDVLVATDVAARGLDVDRITHVFNYDIPHDAESYVHRIGRTGRAGRKGEAILFVTPRERRMLEIIEKSVRVQIERMVMPTNDAINSRRIARFKQRISEVLAAENVDFFAKMVEEYGSETETPIEKVAGALAVMAKGDNPFLLPDEPEAGRTRFEHEDRDQGGRPDRGKKKRRVEPGMVSYRIDVGRRHGASFSAIVGAIANGGGIDGEFIGRIEIYPFHSVVDLPDDLPHKILMSLKNVKVRRRPIQLSRFK